MWHRTKHLYVSRFVCWGRCKQRKPGHVLSFNWFSFLSIALLPHPNILFQTLECPPFKCLLSQLYQMLVSAYFSPFGCFIKKYLASHSVVLFILYRGMLFPINFLLHSQIPDVAESKIFPCQAWADL